MRGGRTYGGKPGSRAASAAFTNAIPVNGQARRASFHRSQPARSWRACSKPSRCTASTMRRGSSTTEPTCLNGVRSRGPESVSAPGSACPPRPSGLNGVRSRRPESVGAGGVSPPRRGASMGSGHEDRNQFPSRGGSVKNPCLPQWGPVTKTGIRMIARNLMSWQKLSLNGVRSRRPESGRRMGQSLLRWLRASMGSGHEDRNQIHL